MDKERVIECSGQYENFVEDMNKIQKQEKIINNILSMLPDSS
jgi:DNA-directed RNA polymerase subunit F